MDRSILANLELVSLLSPRRLHELAQICFVETVSKGLDPFRMNISHAQQVLYLLRGDLALEFDGGEKTVLRGGTEQARFPVGEKKPAIVNALALHDIEIVRIDKELLDIMMTWDQMAEYERRAPGDGSVSGAKLADRSQKAAGFITETSAFNAAALQNGSFSRLPAANIEEMFRRMVSVPVMAGQVIIMQGTEGDYYYLIESGVAEVSRLVDIDSPPQLLAELREGDAFGEEALASDNKRNATVTMKTDGVLYRLKKKDFIELLKAPLLTKVTFADARQQVKNGAIWLDVRFPSEFRFDHLPEAINLPLHEIRAQAHLLNAKKDYIAYCQTGRRSSAAAFILAQLGYKISVLEGGTKLAKAP